MLGMGENRRDIGLHYCSDAGFVLLLFLSFVIVDVVVEGFICGRASCKRVYG